MKKLCTYLTLFVLSLLCLAQPAAAAVFDKSKTYTIDLTAQTWWLDNAPHVQLFQDNVYLWQSDQTKDNGVAKYPYTPDKDGVSQITIKRFHSGNGGDGKEWDLWNEVTIQAPDDPDATYCEVVEVSQSNWTATWKNASGGDQPAETIKVVYLDVNGQDWTAPMLYYCNGWTLGNSGWISGTKVSGGVFKFEFPDYEGSHGEILFAKGENVWGDGNQTDNIDKTRVQNGKLYKLEFTDSEKKKVGGPYDYTEPEPFKAGDPVWIGISGGQDYATNDMLWDSESKLYYWHVDGAINFKIAKTKTRPANLNSIAFDDKLADKSSHAFPVKSSATEVQWGGTKDEAMYVNEGAGFVLFDPEAMSIWFEKEAETPKISASPASCTFAGELSIELSATPEGTNIYYTLNGDTPSQNATKYDGAIKLTNETTVKVFAMNMVNSHSFNFKQAEAQYKYEKSDWTAIPTDTQIYIKGSFINRWGGFVDMTYDEAKGAWYKDFDLNDDANSERAFIMSSSNGSDAENNGIVITHKGQVTDTDKTWPIPTSRPTGDLPNVSRTGHYVQHNFKVAEAGRIYFDPAKGQVWLQGESGTQAYIVAESYGGINNKPWGDNVHKMTWDSKKGIYYAAVRQGTKFMVSLKDDIWSGRYILAGGEEAGAVPAEEPTDANIELWTGDKYSGGDFTTASAGMIYFDAEGLRLWYDPKVTEFFEQGKTYYVNVEEYVGWNRANLGYQYPGESKLLTGFVEIPNEVMGFTNTVEDLHEITLYRKVGDETFGSVTVKAPTDGSNMIYLKSDEKGNLVFDHWGTYEGPEHEHLYILGGFGDYKENGGDWKGAVPTRMDYNARTGIYSYYVADACDLALSRGATNAEFWTADKGLRHIRNWEYNVIHMGEPSYNNLQAGNNSNDKFTLKLFCPSTVYVRFDLTTDPAKPVMHVWSTPDDDKWPDLYIMGAIIAPKGDTQKTPGKNDDTGQWNTIRKLTKSETQPGLYTYKLTKDEVDGVVYFNTNDYWSDAEDSVDKTAINEVGHFNFSFMSGDNTKTFWTDPFCPATKGMGFIDRDGTPEPFVYRGHDAERTKWASTNFVFAEEATIFVDAVRQLIWVELKNEKKPTEVVFHFWDKGGEKYPAAEYGDYRWWNDRKNMNCELYIPGTEFKQNVINTGNKHSFVETMTEGAYRYENQDAGMKYKFVLNGIDSNFIETYDDELNDIKGATRLKDNIWVRIYGPNGKEIIRPYVYDAIYTQGVTDVEYNNYKEITGLREPVVTMKPDIEVIYSDIKAPQHPGRSSADQMIIYPYINQFYAEVQVYQDYLPFYMQDVTEAETKVTDKDGNIVKDRKGNEIEAFPIKEDKRDFFKKTNHAVLVYGDIREIREGSTGVGLIKGLDFANAPNPDKDNLSIKVTYESEGMIFDRSKVMLLSEYGVEETEEDKINGKLPNLWNSDEETNQPTKKYFYGSSNHLDDNGEFSTKDHVALDMIVDMPFKFRDAMRKNRAAYIGYEVKYTNVADTTHVSPENKHVAKSGRPLTWTFMDGDIEEHSAENWHYEAFYDNHLAVQLHHVACAKDKDGLLSQGAKGTITYYMVVPVATDFSFETGASAAHSTPANVRAKIIGANGEEKKPSNIVESTAANPYVGKYSTSRNYSFVRNFEFDGKNTQHVPTGVESVGVEDADAPVEFYNLQGIRMNRESLAPGIYIRRQGNKASKVYVR